MLRYHPYPRVGLSQRELLTHIIEENDPLLPGNEEQEENAPNLLEVVEVPEAGRGLRDRHRKLTALLIVR
ncbi:hypothetical protein C8R48DRAFT_775509 [Suillus tomentosus]|nr:hypothetical protein C8R48DRAFT_775509 [Suillus tomentosus]